MESSKRFSWWVKDPEFFKRLAMLALPMAGQNIITFSVGLADNVMVARLGETAVGGVYVVNQIQNILHMLVIGLGSALVLLGAQYYGKKDVDSVKTLCAVALRLSLLVGLGLSAVMGLFGRSVLGLLTSDAAVIGAGMEYLRYMLWTFGLFCLSGTLLSCLRCVGTVHIGFLISCVTIVTDVGLNYAMIFGKFGFPAMGVAGASASTLISRVLELSIILFYMLAQDQRLRLRPADLARKSRQLGRDFFRYGLPVITGDVLWGVSMAAQSAIIGRLGSAVIAANSMAMNIFQVFAVLVYGTAGAGSLIVGQTIGRNDFALAKKYTQTLQAVYLGVGIFSAALLFSLRNAALGMYTAVSPQTLAYSSRFLLILCVTVIGTSYQMSTLKLVRDGGATNFILINDLIFMWLVVLPLSCVMAFVVQAPPWVVFLSLKSDQLLKCAVAVVKVNRFRWMKNLTRSGEQATSPL